MNNFTGDDIENTDMKLGFHAGITARYFFVKDVFLEGSLGIATKGYKITNQYSSGSSWNDDGYNYDSEVTTKYSSYNLEIPILIGYKYAINKDINIKAKIGPYFTYALAGKQTEKGYEIYYPDIHSSEKGYIDEETKIGDMSGFKNFGYGLHAGLSVEYNRYTLSASYQRGFSKVFDKAKTYEQNFLVSVGYKF